MTTTPPFDFNDFGRQLQAAITDAIKKGLKDSLGKVDVSGLKSKVSSIFDDMEIDQKATTSLDTIRKKLQQIKAQRDAGGRDVLNQINQERALQQEIYREQIQGLDVTKLTLAERLQLYKAAKDEAKKLTEQLETSQEQLEVVEQIYNTQKNYEKTTSKLSSKVKDLMINIKGALSSPKAMAGAATAALEKIGESFSQAFKQMKSEGLSTTQAISEYFNSLKDGALLFSKEVREAQKGFRETGGTLSEAREFGKEAAQAAAKYGGSMEQAGKALGTFQKLPGMSKEAAIAANDFSGALAQAADVPADVVMKEVANNADAVALAGAKNVTNLQKAIINSAKLGVEFSKIQGIANKLLDFESSINAQMEASVLLGREINLDKAREAALRGDYLAVQQEVLKAVGSEAEFTKMNTLQKQKLAEALGIQVGDLAKIVKGQGQDTELAKEAAAARGESASFMDQVKNFTIENAGALASSIPSMILQTAQLILQYKTMQSMRKLAGEDGAGGKKGGILSKVKNFFSFGDKTKTETPELEATDKTKKLSETSDKGPKAKAGEGVRDFLKNLAQGLKAMGDGKVLFGAINLIPTSIGLVAMIPGVVGARLMQIIDGKKLKESLSGMANGIKTFGDGKVIGGAIALAAASIGLVAMIPGVVGAYLIQTLNGKTLKQSLSGLGEGLAALGNAKALMGAGVLALASAAFAVGLIGIPFLALIALAGVGIGTGLIGLSTGLSALANPAVAIGVGLLSVLLLSVGASMLLFGTGVGIAAAGMSLLVTSLKDIPFENLIALPIAFVGIGAGLYMMAAAGLAALPVLGALTALAVVAPALSGLGDILGGEGGGSEEEGKMDTLIAEIRALKDIVSTPAAVTIDGRKVGDAIRLNVNGTAIR